MRETAPDHADAAAHPSRLYLAILALGFLFEIFWRRSMLGPSDSGIVWLYLGGGFLIALGGALLAWSIRSFRNAGTPVPIGRPTVAIVTSGPYRYSRNPIYIALTAIYLGIGIAADSQWVLALTVPMLAIVRFGVIAREERYLEMKFGQTYLAYKGRVRRWI